MSKTIRAVFENGVLRPLDNIELAEHTEVVLTFESRTEANEKATIGIDPLLGINFASGLGDLAQNFEDYRFGRK